MLDASTLDEAVERVRADAVGHSRQMLAALVDAIEDSPACWSLLVKAEEQPDPPPMANTAAGLTMGIMIGLELARLDANLAYREKAAADVLKWLAQINGTVSIHDGVATAEDGVSVDLSQWRRDTAGEIIQ